MILRKANVYDTNDIAKVHCEVWEDYYGKYVSEAFLERVGYDNRRKFWLKYITEGNNVFVMEEKTGGIIGFVVPKISKYKAKSAVGEVLAHYVAKGSQKKNYGTALLVACAKLFVKNNATTMSLWVHRDNPSTIYYKNRGGEEVDAKLDRLDHKDIVKLNYVWTDLEGFINRNEGVFENIVREY